MFLFFDTETTGLPKSWKAPVTDLDNWPRLVQIGWQLYDSKQNLLESVEYIIRPDGFTIPKAASDVHGISTERALAEGDELSEVLNKFRGSMLKADYLIAHNINFDEMIVGAEFIRMKTERLPKKLPRICTMKSAINFCAIPSRNGYSDYKFPNLTELHKKLFQKGFDDAHTALADVEACANCFFELKQMGVITIPV